MNLQIWLHNPYGILERTQNEVAKKNLFIE